MIRQRSATGSDSRGRIAAGGGTCEGSGSGVVQAQEGDHVVLVDAIAGDADRADDGRAAVDRHAAGKDLRAIGKRWTRGWRDTGDVILRTACCGEQPVVDEVQLVADVEGAPASDRRGQLPRGRAVDARWEHRPEELGDAEGGPLRG